MKLDTKRLKSAVAAIQKFMPNSSTLPAYECVVFKDGYMLGGGGVGFLKVKNDEVKGLSVMVDATTLATFSAVAGETTELTIKGNSVTLVSGKVRTEIGFYDASDYPSVDFSIEETTALIIDTETERAIKACQIFADENSSNTHHNGVLFMGGWAFSYNGPALCGYPVKVDVYNKKLPGALVKYVSNDDEVYGSVVKRSDSVAVFNKPYEAPPLDFSGVITKKLCDPLESQSELLDRVVKLASLSKSSDASAAPIPSVRFFSRGGLLYAADNSVKCSYEVELCVSGDNAIDVYVSLAQLEKVATLCRQLGASVIRMEFSKDGMRFLCGEAVVIVRCLVK